MDQVHAERYRNGTDQWTMLGITIRVTSYHIIVSRKVPPVQADPDQKHFSKRFLSLVPAPLNGVFLQRCHTVASSCLSPFTRVFFPLPLPFTLPDHLWRTIFNQAALVVQRFPFWQPVWHIHTPLTIKDVFTRFEEFFLFLCLELDQAWKEQYHVTTFIHNRRMTICASNFAWKVMLN